MNSPVFPSLDDINCIGRRFLGGIDNLTVHDRYTAQITMPYFFCMKIITSSEIMTKKTK